jgi:hypothetical protein
MLLTPGSANSVLPLPIGLWTVMLDGGFATRQQNSTAWDQMLGTVAHELKHFTQWSSTRVTTQGEAEAYALQGQVYQDLGLAEPNWYYRDAIVAAQAAMNSGLAVDLTLRFRSEIVDMVPSSDLATRAIYDNQQTYPVLIPWYPAQLVYQVYDRLRWGLYE